MSNETEKAPNPPLNLESLEWVIPLEEILQEIPYYGIYVCDLSGKVLFWNRGAEMLTGFTPEEVIGRSSTGELLQLIDSKGKALAGNNDLVQNCLEQGMESSQKIQLISKAGHPLSAQLHFLPIKDRQ